MRTTALITGASSGIGKELAFVCAEKGHDLVLVGRDIGELQDTASSIEAQHQKTKVLLIQKDLTDPHAVEEIAHKIEKEDLHIHILINNAGSGSYGLFYETPWSELLNMMHLNMVALTELTWRILPGMMRGKHGYIMNLGSIASFQPGPLMAVYYATKAYVLSFSEALKYELRDTDISVTCLCPPQTDTKFDERAGMQHSKAFRERKVIHPRIVAVEGYDALMRGKDIHVTGARAKIQTLLPRFLSHTAATAFSKNELEPATHG
jgi:uncharacterized protein